jgi:hypothetical protein
MGRQDLSSQLIKDYTESIPLVAEAGYKILFALAAAVVEWTMKRVWITVQKD